MTTVGILDYVRSGNVQSVKNMLLTVTPRVAVVREAGDLDKVDRLILPGVANFRDVMEHLRAVGLEGPLRERIRQIPTLGICLGMQILATWGFESGKTRGLEVFQGEVRRMDVAAPVPHLGWATLRIIRPCPLLEGIGPDDPMYFMHSYEMVNYTDVTSLASYADHIFVASLVSNNVYGVQFHPEKSREAGRRVLRNFIALGA